ncbi:MAG: DMT family transporter [Sterolibacterium sp.]|jgi:drug/metabolite transporter (DMT)-like permease
MNQRIRPDAAAFALMVILCAAWGLQQIAVKVAMAGISPILQGGLRSAGAAALLLGWVFWRGQPLLVRDGSLRPGLLSGTLFALEFIFIYVGLSYTNASRMVVFLYTAPCFTVLGLHLWVAGERLALPRLLGVGLAFAGIALAFADGWEHGGHWIGDLCGLAAAVFWAATTVLIRATALARISAAKVLLYQLLTSAALMLLLSVLVGESGVTALTPVVIVAMVYQVVIVAFASFLIWFWLLTRYLASRLTVFTFLTPLFGVGFGVLLLDEKLSLTFGFAALLVVAGIVLVNLPARKN